MRPTHNGKQTKYHTKGEGLLRHVDFVSDSEPASFGQGQIAWEASTLPLSYTRQSRIHSSFKKRLCEAGFIYSLCDILRTLFDLHWGHTRSLISPLGFAGTGY